MKASYHISEDDYVKAVLLASKSPKWMAAILLGVAFFLIALAIFGESQQVRSEAIFGLIGGVSGYSIVRFWSRPRKIRRQYHLNKTIGGEKTVGVDEMGLRFYWDHGNSFVPWSNILKWKMNDDFILIYQMPVIFNIILRNGTSGDLSTEKLADLLNRHVGKPV